MKFFKKTFCFILFILMIFPAFATKARYVGEDYEIKLVYNKEVFPGDPVFIEAQVKKNRQFSGKLKAKASIIEAKTEKEIVSSVFFQIKENGPKNSAAFMCMIPTSSYLKENDYKIKIEYEITGKENSYFMLPVEYNKKTFVQEDIKLNQKNTAIKQNQSPERMTQIKNLNSILDTKNYDSYKKTALTSFSEPLVCNRRTSFFADRRCFIYSDGSKVTNLHYGIDYGVKTGTEVFACSKGKVVMAENRISTGWSVCIEHLPGLYSLYYHMDELNVKVGDVVTEGQLIGKSGCTGLATGPHLHWEIRLNMEAVNPDWFVQTYPIIFLQEKEKYFRQ